MFARFMRDMYDPIDYRYAVGGIPSLLMDDYVSSPRMHMIQPRRQDSSILKKDDSKKDFKVMLNVKHFRPEEIEVKTVENCIVIHGKHDEHADGHGFVSREFTRRFQLPEDVDPRTVKSSLNQEGVLTVSAPKKAVDPPPKNERVVPIVIQKPAAVEVQKQKQLQEQQAPEQLISVEHK